MKLEGRVWRYGDNVDTGMMIDGKYSYIRDLTALATHAMEPVDPNFVNKVRQGDVIVAGSNFGCGSSREAAPVALKAAGIGAIVALSFSRTFFRNAINIGLPVIKCGGALEIEEGDWISIDTATGRVVVKESRKVMQGSVLPDFLQEIIEAGGLISYKRTRRQSVNG